MNKNRLFLGIISNMLVAFSVIILLSACAESEVAKGIDDAQLKTPTKEILVTDGDLSKPYNILGEVEYTLNGGSAYADEIAIKKEVDSMLRKVAFTKYGEEVDAIINVQQTESVNGGFWGTVAAGYGAHTIALGGHGIAVHFK